MSGKVEVEIDILMICWMAGARYFTPSFKVLVSIKSIPVADEFFKLLITFSTSQRDIVLS